MQQVDRCPNSTENKQNIIYKEKHICLEHYLPCHLGNHNLVSDIVISLHSLLIQQRIWIPAKIGEFHKVVYAIQTFPWQKH